MKMKNHVYSLISILSLAAPLAFSFEETLGFYHHILPILLAIASSGVMYLLWDIMATHHGDWSFNPVYTGTRQIFGLPLGELLFFICMPYACLFLYEVVRQFFISEQLFIPSRLFLISGSLAFITAGFLFRRHNYTLLVSISVAALMATLAISRPYLLGHSTFLIWIGFCFLFFIVVNALITGLPTIRYNNKATLGIKVFTIPVENFFYHLAYLGFTLNFYLFFQSLLATS